jgi:Glutamine synthetase
MAVELEFYLFELEPDSEGRPRLSAAPFGGGRATTSTNSIEELEAIGGFLGEVESFCRLQQIPASVVSSEMAAGQFEINLHHVDQPLAAGDHAFLLRRVIQAAAKRHAMRASFMAKPFLDAAGSGMHVHVSIVDDRGRNMFDDGTPAGSAMLRQAIGGLHQAMPESQAIFAPSLNAFRRFGPGQFVPLNRFWGYNNRAVAFRVPTGPSAARRIEHRIAGADANPYLVLAAILAGIHHGIATSADPGSRARGMSCSRMPVQLRSLDGAGPVAKSELARALYRPRLSPDLCRGEARRARPLPRPYRAARIRLVSVRIHA